MISPSQLAALSEAVRDDQGLFSKYYATDSDMHGAEIIALSAESAQSTASPPATSAPWTYAPFTYAPWTNAPAGETNTPHVSYAPRPSYLPWTYTPRTSVPYASFSHYEEDDEDDGSPASGMQEGVLHYARETHFHRGGGGKKNNSQQD